MVETENGAYHAGYFRLFIVHNSDTQFLNIFCEAKKQLNSTVLARLSDLKNLVTEQKQWVCFH